MPINAFKTLILLSIMTLLLSGCSDFCWADTASYYTRASCLTESGQAVMANGKELDDDAYTCAMWGVPFGTRLLVENVANGKTVMVVVEDRGPAKRLVRKGRIIDLSRVSFARIADLRGGVIRIEIQRLGGD